MFAADEIDRTQLARITATERAKRTVQEAALASARASVIPAESMGPLARAAWTSFTIEQQRDIVRELIAVTILPLGAGRRTFDPDSVRIAWR